MSKKCDHKFIVFSLAWYDDEKDEKDEEVQTIEEPLEVMCEKCLLVLSREEMKAYSEGAI